MHWHRPLDDVVYFEDGLVLCVKTASRRWRGVDACRGGGVALERTPRRHRISGIPAVRPGKDVGVRARLVEPPRLQLIVKPLRRLELGVDPARTFGIGVGLPGAIELAAIHSAGAQWSTHPVAQDLAARFGVPAFADQDVNLLALGEHAQGWPDAQSLLCVKVGSVIACGVVAGGRIIGGADGLAGDIGHTRIAGRDEPCVCGNVGCLNAVAGGAALVKQLAAAGVGVGHVRDVVRLAQQGSVPARAAIRQAGRDLGTVLAGAVNLLNPRVIAFWGYLVGDEESLLAGVRETLYQGAAPSATHNLMLISSELGDTTGLNGSALMVAEEVLAPRAVDRRLDRTASSVSNG